MTGEAVIPEAYRQAPAPQEEHEDLVHTMRTLPARERLVRRAALADRSTLEMDPADGKAMTHFRSAALKLVRYDVGHGISGPMDPVLLAADAPLDALRAYIRREYAAWHAEQTG